MKRALFIGRFQPFHLGHLSVLHEAKRLGWDEVIIGIGSSQYSNTDDNPLTYEQRVEIIAASTAHDKAVPKLHVIPLPDIHDDATWVRHINTIISQHELTYDIVLTGNAHVQSLFEVASISVKIIEPSITVNGTTIRNYIHTKNPEWQNFIHPNAQSLIRKYL